MIKPESNMFFNFIKNWSPKLHLEALIFFSSLFFSLFCNDVFWKSAMESRPYDGLTALSILLSLIGIHSLLLGVVVWRWNYKIIFTVIYIATAIASYYMKSFHVYFDTTMLHNIIATDVKESRELLTWGLLPVLIFMAGLPIFILMRVEIINVSIGHAIAFRTAFLIACALSTILGIMISFQDISSLIRNKREVRYLITPANYIVGLPRVIYHAKPVKPSERLPIGEDAVQINSPINRRPRLLVFVLGETVRAQNWGLNGYSRQTTAQLVNINGIVNFSDMHACGTSTAVSVPCLFSPFGRHNYDESRIRDHQSLLHVLERVDIKTLWRDNQSGCKGVCDGLAFNDMSKDSNHSLCSNGRCFDEILLDNLAKDIRNIPGDRFIVLHQLGNHGPSYFERYPSEYRRFTPTCDTANLGQCTREQIINSYDNAILYTDNFLARAIELVGQMKEYDSLMIYVSDHGESLGEKGLYLHGAPYSIAPKEQTKIPMTMWFSDNFLKDNSINMDCLNKRSESYTDHDVIFSTVLSFFQVKTSIYDESRDLFYSCALSR